MTRVITLAIFLFLNYKIKVFFFQIKKILSFFFLNKKLKNFLNLLARNRGQTEKTDRRV